MTGFIKFLKDMAIYSSPMAAFYVLQLFLTPQQAVIAMAIGCIIVLSGKVDNLSKRTSPTLNTNKKFRKAF